MTSFACVVWWVAGKRIPRNASALSGAWIVPRPNLGLSSSYATHATRAATLYAQRIAGAPGRLGRADNSEAEFSEAAALGPRERLCVCPRLTLEAAGVGENSLGPKRRRGERH